MSEENKTVELKDEELEKVSGGYTLNVGDNVCGTWFYCSICQHNTYFSPNVNMVGQTITASCPNCHKETTLTGASYQGNNGGSHGFVL